MTIGESHENGRTPCAYKRVNGVTFCFVVHSYEARFELLYVFMNVVLIQYNLAIPSRWHKGTS